MIRTFLEFLLSRSLDDGTPPTGWLRNLLVRDAKLNRFEAKTRQLDTLLRGAAVQQRQAMATDDPIAVLTLPPHRQTAAGIPGKNSRHTLAWFGGLAACTILSVVVASNGFRPAAPTVHASELSQQLTVVPGEVLRLLTSAANTSQTQLPQLSPLANLTLPALPTWQEVALHVESPVRQEMGIWQESWQNLRSRLPSAPQEL